MLLMEKRRSHKDVRVYQLSFEAGMEIMGFQKLFPKKKYIP